MLVYDISTNPTLTQPIGHYVLELPILDRDPLPPPAVNSPNRTAAQSEVLALNNHQFLLLTRDGNGLGVDDGRPLVFKSIYLVDINGATNLAGTAFENSTTQLPYLPGTVNLNTALVTPVTTAELVNILNTDQLARLGLSNAVVSSHPTIPTNLLSEKWESFGLVPAFDPLNPYDWFLLVGNDNDFGTPNGIMSQLSTSSGAPSGSGIFSAGVVNDNMISGDAANGGTGSRGICGGP